MNFNSYLLNTIKLKMAKNGLTQQEMADKLEMTLANLNRILTGKIKKANGRTSKKIIEFLGNEIDFDKLEL